MKSCLAVPTKTDMEQGDTIIIMRALSRENIDEVIKLSEDYNRKFISEMPGFDDSLPSTASNI